MWKVSCIYCGQACGFIQPPLSSASEYHQQGTVWYDKGGSYIAVDACRECRKAIAYGIIEITPPEEVAGQEANLVARVEARKRLETR